MWWDEVGGKNRFDAGCHKVTSEVVSMSFDLEDVKNEAAAALQGNNVEEARGVYMAAIMDVGDCLLSIEEDNEIRPGVLEYAITLWKAYAQMEISLRQWKKAVEVYENALKDQFVSKFGSIYKTYSNYCRDRNRLQSAKRVLVTGLSVVSSQTDVDVLWKELLLLEQLKNPEITLNDLVGEISSQVGEVENNVSLPSEGLNEAIKNALSDTEDGAEAKISDDMSFSEHGHAPSSSSSSSTVNVMTIDNPNPKIDSLASNGDKHGTLHEGMDMKNFTRLVESIGNHLGKTKFDLGGVHARLKAECEYYDLNTLTQMLELEEEMGAGAETGAIKFDPETFLSTDDSVLEPMELVQKYRKRPPKLFVAPTIEPMYGGIKHLHPVEKKILEDYLGAPMESFKNSTGNTNTPGEMVVDFLQSLWVMQALKESHFDAWYSQLQDMHGTNEQRLLSICSQKEANAKPNDPIRAKCQKELKDFYDKCSVQTCVLDATLNKIFYELLAVQQHILASIGFPFFTKSFASHMLNTLEASNYDRRTLDILEKQKVLVSIV